MKRIIISLLHTIIATLAVSCGSVFEHFGDPDDDIIIYADKASICVVNKTDQILQLELNWGDNYMDDTHYYYGDYPSVLDVDTKMVVHSKSSGWYYDEAGGRVFPEGEENQVTIHYCDDYLSNLPNDSYLRVYNDDGVLLCEWTKDDNDPLFDCNFYTHTVDFYIRTVYQTWDFIITEDMLNVD